MYNFFSRKQPSDGFCHDQSMFSDISSSLCHLQECKRATNHNHALVVRDPCSVNNPPHPRWVQGSRHLLSIASKTLLCPILSSFVSIFYECSCPFYSVASARAEVLFASLLPTATQFEMIPAGWTYTLDHIRWIGAPYPRFHPFAPGSTLA